MSICTNIIEVYGEAIAVEAFQDDFENEESLREFLRHLEQTDLEDVEESEIGERILGSEAALSAWSFYWESETFPTLNIPAALSARYPKLSMRFIYENLEAPVAGTQYFDDGTLIEDDTLNFSTVLGEYVRHGLLQMRSQDIIERSCTAVKFIQCTKVESDDDEVLVNKFYTAELRSGLKSTIVIHTSSHGSVLGYTYSGIVERDWLQIPFTEVFTP